MGLKLTVTIQCDRCLVALPTLSDNRTTHAQEVCWAAKHVATKQGWLILSRGRYHTPAYYCPVCADKPSRPIRDERKKRAARNG